MFVFSEPTDDIESCAISEGKIYDVELGIRIPMIHKILISMKDTCSITAPPQFLENFIRENFLVIDNGYMHSAQK